MALVFVTGAIFAQTVTVECYEQDIIKSPDCTVCNNPNDYELFTGLIVQTIDAGDTVRKKLVYPYKIKIRLDDVLITDKEAHSVFFDFSMTAQFADSIAFMAWLKNCHFSDTSSGPGGSYSWFANGGNDIHPSTEIAAGATVNFTGLNGVVVGLPSSGSTTLNFNGSLLQWFLDADSGTAGLVGDAGSQETVNILGGSGISTAITGLNVTVTNTGDLSTTNEIQGLNFTGSAGGPVTLDISSSSDDITFTAGTNISFNRVGDDLTITAATPTSYSLSTSGSFVTTLIGSGTTVQFLEGTGIDITFGGTSGAATLTFASTIVDTDTDDQGLTYSGSSGGPVGLNIDGGSDVTITAGTNITLNRVGTDLEISASGGGAGTDLTWTGSGPFNLLSSTGTDVTVSEGANVNVTRVSNDLEFAAIPSGSNTEIQFNNSGSFGADNSFIWDATNNRLALNQTSNGNGVLNITKDNTDNTNISGAGTHINLNNPNAAGYNVISSYINGSLVGKTVYDFAFSTNYYAFTAADDRGHYFYTNSASLELNMIITRTGVLVSDDNLVSITTTPTQALDVRGNMRLTGAFYDVNNQAGSSGQILTSTGTGTDWVTGVLTDAQNITFTGSGPFTLDISGGTDVTITEGPNIDITRVTNDLSISAIPSGSTTHVQYNSSGAFAGNSGFTYNGTDVGWTGMLENSSFNTSATEFQLGSFYIQAYALNNTLITDNAYYNGSSFTRPVTGYAHSIQFESGTFNLALENTGTGTFTNDNKVVVDYSGNFGLGNAIGAAFANATFYHEGSTGEIGIGTITPSQPLHVVGNARITGAVYDSNNDPGNSGQIMSSTVTGWDWIAAVVNTDAQTLSISGGTSPVLNISGASSPISFAFTGGTFTSTGSSITFIANDQSATNEIQNLTYSGAAGGPVTLNIDGTGATDVTLTAGSNITFNRVGTDLEISASSGGYSWDIGVNGGSYTTISNTEQVSINGAGINVASIVGNVITITGTEVDGSTTNEIQNLTFTGASAPFTLDISGGTDVTFEDAGILVITRSSNQLIFTATEVDGSTSNELDTWDLGANASYTTISTTEQVNFVGAGIAVSSRSGNTITYTATEVDGSISNEGSLTVTAGSASTSVIHSNTSGGADVTLTEAGIIDISENTGTGTITISATEVDGSTTNELQDLGFSGASSPVTLTITGGASVSFVAGTNTTLSQSAGALTINSTGGSTDLTFTGSGPFNLLSSTGTDVTITEGLNIDITRSSNDLSFKATPTGSDTYVQFNDGGSTFGGDAGFVYNKTTDVSTIAGGLIIKNNTLDGSNLMVSDANRTLAGVAQTTTVKVLGSVNTFNNLMHLDNNQTGGRPGFIISNSSTGAWQDNFMSFQNHGLSYAGNYYITGYSGKTSDGGWNTIISQGSSILGTLLMSYDASPIVFGTTNTPRIVIAAGGNVSIGNNASPSQELTVTGDIRVTGAYYDSNNDPGSSGQIMSSTVTGTDWIAAVVNTDAQNLTFTGSGPFTLDISGGTDVTITEGSNIDISRTTNDLSFSAIPSGSNTHVQYNSSGAFAGNSGFTYNGTDVGWTGMLENSSFNTSATEFQLGSFYIQAYALNNTLITDNAYYNGSSFTRPVTGYAHSIQFESGTFNLALENTGTGTFTNDNKVVVDYSGNFGLGNAIGAAFANATFYHEGSTGKIGIGTITPSQKLHVVGNARVTGAYYDSNNSPGSSGEVLSSTVTGTDWITNSSGATDLSYSGTSSGPVTLNSSTGTDVTITASSNIGLNRVGTDLAIYAIPATGNGNVQINDMGLFGGESAFSYNTSTNRLSIDNIYVPGVYWDKDGQPGTSGQVLSSTVTGTDWITISSGATDLTFTGSGPFTLNSSTGTDVTFTEGANIDITRSSNDLSFKATPTGSDTYMQFNDGGSTFGGDAGFVYNKTTDVSTIAGGLIIKNNTLDGASLMVSDANRTLAGVAQTTTVKVLGSVNTFNNLMHLDNNQTGGRPGFVISNSSTGGWQDNFMSFQNHGLSYAGNYYITGYSGKTSDGGWNTIISQGSSILGTLLMSYDASPIVFGTTNTPRIVIAAGGNVSIGNNASPSQELTVTGDIRVTGAFYDSNNDPGTSGQTLSSTVTGTDWVAKVVPGGSDTHVQYNNSGAFGGEADFRYDASTNSLVVPATRLDGGDLRLDYTRMDDQTKGAYGTYLPLVMSTIDGEVYQAVPLSAGYGTSMPGDADAIVGSSIITLTGNATLPDYNSGSAIAGYIIIVRNASGSAINISPPSGDELNDVTSAYSLAAGTVMMFIKFDADDWYTK